jgi:hypothetical protein
MGTDFVYPVGADIAETQSPEVQPDVKTDGARYDIELEAYTPRYNWSSYPPLPKPYDTFTDQLSYGPEGNPALKKEAV